MILSKEWFLSKISINHISRCLSRGLINLKRLKRIIDILPTCGTARFSSGMSMQEFMRGYSVIQYSEAALKKKAEYIIELAEAEGMNAHALVVKVRKADK